MEPLLLTYGLPLISVVVVSALSLIGIFTLSLKENALREGLFALVSLAVGALLGDAFIHLIPESFETAANPALVPFAIIGGILIFFVIEKFLHWHHHHGLEASEPDVHPTGKMILVSDGVHNFLDGLIIGASYFVSVEVGMATTLAVILHEIPQEIGDFGVLLHAGYTKARALLMNFVSALLAIAGVGVAFLLGSSSEVFAAWLIPVAAGGFIYVAMTDLIPELHKNKRVSHSLIQIFAILLGILAMAGLLLIEPGHEEEGPAAEESVETTGPIDFVLPPSPYAE
jgi:zinc and cadmium transporter